MASEAGRVEIILGLDMAELREGVDNAARSIEDLGANIQQTGAALTRNLTGPITAVGAALGGLTVSTANYADEIDKTSQRTGIATDTLQELRFAAQQSGAGIESLDRMVSSFTRRLGQVQEGTGRAAEAMQKLGVDIEDSSGQMRDQGAILEETLTSLASMENQTQRNAIGAQVLGRGFQDLIPLLNQGEEGMDALRKQARDMGLVMEEDSIRAFVQLKDAGSALWEQLKSVGRNLVTAFLPTIELMVPIAQAVIDQIRTLSEWIGSMSREMQFLTAATFGTLAALGPLLWTGGKIISMFGKLISGVMRAAAAVRSFAAALWAAMTPLTAKIAAVAALAGSVWLIHRNWSQLGDFFQGIWQGILSGMRSFTQLVVLGMQNMWQRVQNTFARAVSGLFGFFEGLAGQLGISSLEDRFGALADSAASAIDDEAVRETSARMDDLRGSLLSGFSGLADGVRDIAGNIRDSIFDMIPEPADLSEFATGRGEGGFTPELTGDHGGMGEGLRSASEGIRELATGFEEANTRMHSTDHLLPSVVAGAEHLREKAHQLRLEMMSFGEVASFAIRDMAMPALRDFSHDMGTLVGNVLTLQSGLSGIGEAFVEMGEIARNAIRNLIADLVQATVKAAALAAITAMIPGLGQVGFMGSLQGVLGIGGAQMPDLLGGSQAAHGLSASIDLEKLNFALGRVDRHSR